MSADASCIDAERVSGMGLFHASPGQQLAECENLSPLAVYFHGESALCDHPDHAVSRHDVYVVRCLHPAARFLQLQAVLLVVV